MTGPEEYGACDAYSAVCIGTGLCAKSVMMFPQEEWPITMSHLIGICIAVQRVFQWILL